MKNDSHIFLNGSFFKNLANIKDLNKIAIRLEEKNVPLLRCNHIGQGSWGNVFEINDDMVLKITKDRSELNSAEILKYHPHPYFVKIYDVFKCKLKKLMYYFIIEEKLIKPDKNWKSFAWDLFSFLEEKMVTPTSVRKYLKQVHSVKIKTKNNQLKNEWILSIGNYFWEHNIKFCDLHENNLMKRLSDNNHVVIDIGCCIAPKQRIDCLN